MKPRYRSLLALLASLVVLGVGLAQYVRQRNPAPSGPPTAAALDATARALVAAGPAAQGHESKDRVRALLATRLAATGGKVQELPFRAQLASGESWLLHNLVVSFNPAAKRRLLLGGHWDTRPWADEDPDPARRLLPVTGANDGVSNTAVLLEVADALARRPLPPELGVDVVFFDGEEGPKGTPDYFLGSRDLAESWFRTGLAAPAEGLVLDMVGKRGLRLSRELTSRGMARRLQDEVWALAKARGATVFVETPGKAVTDDHVAFLQRGIPVILLIDLEYPQWHTAADTLEQLDPAAMAQVADVVLAWVEVRALAAAPVAAAP